MLVAAPPRAVYQVFSKLGGGKGWLFTDWRLWKLRSQFDKFFGGPSLRGRGDELLENDPLDYYRVESPQENHLMRLRSELNAPGAGWMEWRVESTGDHGSILTQTAFFAPRDLTGFLYWHLLNPFHILVFRGLIRQIVQRAELISELIS